MPIIKSAKKAVLSSARKRVMNLSRRKTTRDAVRAALTTPSAETLSAAYKAVDKSAKRQIIHKNKAARIKSRLAKVLGKTT